MDIWIRRPKNLTDLETEKSLPNYLPHVLSYLTCLVPLVLSCLTCFMPYVLSCPAYLVLYILLCLTCLVHYVFSCFTCLLPYMICASRVLYPMYPRASRVSSSRALVSHVSYVLFYFTCPLLNLLQVFQVWLAHVHLMSHIFHVLFLLWFWCLSYLSFLQPG